MSGLDQFLDILLKPDNIPIAGMLLLVFFFTWIGLKQARRNERSSLGNNTHETELLGWL